MEPISALVAIIAAGASNALSDTAGKAVKDAYEGVKALLASKLKTWTGLESAPQDSHTKNAVALELKQNAASDDPEVLAAIKQLQISLQAVPQVILARSGVSIGDVNAASDILIKDIKYGKYFDVQRVQSITGKIEISGLSGNSDLEKN